MRSVRLRTAVALVLAAAPLSVSAQVGDTVGDLIVGQPDATSRMPNATGVNASGVDFPAGVAFDAEGNLFVADTSNSRVLGYRSPFTTDLVADIVIGQPDFQSRQNDNGGVSASRLSFPLGLAVNAKGDLWVADNGNGRVLEFDRPFATDTVADFVIGQPDFTTDTNNEANVDATTLFTPADVALDPDGNLWVADGGHNRVLEYEDPVATRDAVADIVLGQPDFTSSAGNTDDVSARTLSFPGSIAIDSHRDVWVTDLLDNRVLEFDDPRNLDTAADRTLGQPDFTSSSPNYTGAVDANGLLQPSGVKVDANDNVYVSDTFNHRVLVYTAPIATSDRVADRVFGQPDFNSHRIDAGDGVSARGLDTPQGLAFDANGDLAVTDFGNNRIVLIQAPTPIVSSLQVKVAPTTRKAKLVIRGVGFETGRAVVEVGGTQLSTTRYKEPADDGTSRRLVASDADFDALVPRGTRVTVVVVNLETGGRSAPIAFTR